MTVKAPSSPNIPPPLGIAGQIGVYLVQMAKDVTWFLYQITQRANATLPEDGSERMTGPLPVVQYATADLPSAAAYPDSIVWDSTALAMKYSDGTNWIIFAGGSSSPASVVYFGSGDPSTLHNNGDLYFDTATTPYTPWVQNSGAWDQYGMIDASAGTYGAASSVPILTLDSHRRLTTLTTTTVSGAGGADANPLMFPQGRLTLQSNFAVQTIDQVGVSTIYYGLGLVPIYNGSKWIYLPCDSQISMGLDAVTPHVANHNLYNVFGISNSGTLALCIGPAWSNTATITATIATPAVISWTAHKLSEGSPVVFTTTGALPTGITAGTTYFVGKSPGTNSFNISTSVANAAAGTFVATSGTQSGTHTGTNGTASSNGAPVGVSLQNGIWVNASILTHAWGGASGTTDYGPVAAGSATWLGTFLATADGQTTMQTNPAAAAGGSNTIMGLYNLYNRVRLTGTSRDSTASWSYNSATWRAADGNVNNRITFVDGAGQSPIAGTWQVLVAPPSAGSGYGGMSLDSTTGNPQVTGQYNFATSAPAYWMAISDAWAPGAPGIHFLQAQEASTATSQFFGAQATPTRQLNGLTASLWM